MEGKSYSELTAGAETDKELDDCTLLTNSQGKELLAPGRGSQYNAEKKVAIPLTVRTTPALYIMYDAAGQCHSA